MPSNKTGFSYFSIDTDRYQDIRIKRLKKTFGCMGIAVYDYVLCEIYRVRGCFIEWDESTAFDVAEYFDLKESQVIETINYCCAVGLFNKELLASGSILTSASIQKRFIEMSMRAKRKEIIIPEVCKIPEETPKVPEKTAIIPEELPKIPEETNKVKKSRVKNNPPLPPLGGSESEKTWKNDFEVYKAGLRNAFRDVREDADWLKQQERLNPNIDILLSIEKACVNYWSTEGAWKKKKKEKIESINWKSTFGNAIGLNKVYKQQNDNQNEQKPQVFDI